MGPKDDIFYIVGGDLDYAQSVESLRVLIETLGARVLKRLTKNVTHILLPNEDDVIDLPASVQKAEKRGVKMVDEAWLLGKKSGEDSEEDELPRKKTKLIAVDEFVRPTVRENCHVVVDGDTPYACMLNQTNIDSNNNKFYVIQMLENNNENEYYVFTRWGRVGASGQLALKEFANKEDAQCEFESKYNSKTSNKWGSKGFVKKPRKYHPIDIDYETDPQEDSRTTEAEKIIERSATANEEKPIRDSKLAKAVQELVKLICNVNMMKSQMKDFQLDIMQMPLGKLSKKQILNGYKVLQEIATAMNGARDRGRLLELSSKFYTLIPHSFGMRRPPIIDSDRIVMAKMEILQTLGDIEIADKLLQSAEDSVGEHPVDAKYRQLGCSLDCLDKSSDEYDMVNRYLANTHGDTHAGYRLEIVDLFKANRKGENSLFSKYKSLDNHRLLWHGSRLSNYMGILSQGLRIAPPEAPSTGYMFGKGIYFADSVSKRYLHHFPISIFLQSASANYCHTNNTDGYGILLLCEVALGNMYGLEDASYMNEPPDGYHSVWGKGRNTPEGHETINDVIVPLGKLVRSDVTRSSLIYNEFIVYSTDQVLIRYVVRVNFRRRYA